MTDTAPRPICVEVFAGNTADPTAFISAVDVVRTLVGVDTPRSGSDSLTADNDSPS